MSSSLPYIQVLRNDPDEADKFKEEDSVVINPTEEEIDEQIVKMEARRARVKAEKKAAKAAEEHGNSHSVDSAQCPVSFLHFPMRRPA